MTASPSRPATAMIAAAALFGMYLALPLPTVAQDTASKQPTAEDKLGAQPIASKDDEERRRREEEQRRAAALQKQQQQQRQLDEALKQDIYKKKLSQEEKLRDKEARDRKAAALLQQRQLDRGLRQGVDPNAKPPARNSSVPSGYTSSQAAIDKREAQRRLQQDYLREQDRKRRETETRQNNQRQTNASPRANDPSKKQQDELDKGLRQNPYAQPTRPATPLTSPGPHPTPAEQKREKDAAKRKWDKEYDDEVQKNNPKKKPQG